MYWRAGRRVASALGKPRVIPRIQFSRAPISRLHVSSGQSSNFEIHFLARWKFTARVGKCPEMGICNAGYYCGQVH